MGLLPSLRQCVGNASPSAAVRFGEGFWLRAPGFGETSRAQLGHTSALPRPIQRSVDYHSPSRQHGMQVSSGMQHRSIPTFCGQSAFDSHVQITHFWLTQHSLAAPQS